MFYADPRYGNIIHKYHYEHDLSNIVDRASRLFATSNNLNAALEREGGISSSSEEDSPHQWEETSDLRCWLIDTIKNNVCDDWDFYPSVKKNLIFDNSWVNKHPPGAWTDEHTHGGMPVVVSFYLEQPVDSGYFQFFDPLYSVRQSPEFGRMSPWVTVPTVTGDALIFPGWLYHKTQPNNSTQRRFNMTFNIAHNRK